MAKAKQTRRMMAMALAAAVAMSSMPVVAFAEDGSTNVVADGEGANESTDTVENESAVEGTVTEGPINITVEIPSTDTDDPDTEDTENKNTETYGPEVGTQEGDVPTSDNDRNYDYTEITQQGSVTVETTEITSTTQHGDSDLDYVSSETVPDATNDLVTEIPSAAPEEQLPGYQQPEGDGTETPETGDDITVEAETPTEEATLAEVETPTVGEQPAEIETPAEGDEYQFEYVGTGNTSQLRPAVVFTESMTEDEIKAAGEHKTYGAYINSYADLFLGFHPDPSIAARDENGKLIRDENGFVLDKDGNRILKAELTSVGPDGKTYYLHRIDNVGENLFVEGWYQDGEWLKELNAPAAVDENNNPVLETVQLVELLSSKM